MVSSCMEADPQAFCQRAMLTAAQQAQQDQEHARQQAEQELARQRAERERAQLHSSRLARLEADEVQALKAFAAAEATGGWGGALVCSLAGSGACRQAARALGICFTLLLRGATAGAAWALGRAQAR